VLHGKLNSFTNKQQAEQPYFDILASSHLHCFEDDQKYYYGT
jgi:hypothetical protein